MTYKTVLIFFFGFGAGFLLKDMIENKDIGLKKKALETVQDKEASQKTKPPVKLSVRNRDVFKQALNLKKKNIEDEAKVLTNSSQKESKVFKLNSLFRKLMDAKLDEDVALQLDLLEKMRVIDPESHIYMDSIADYHMRKGDRKKAYKLYKDCSKIHPKKQSCIRAAATFVFQALEDKEDQLIEINSCLDNIPGDVVCLNMLGVYSMQNNQFEKAVEVYEILVRDNSSNGIRLSLKILHAQLGHAYEGVGRNEDAKESFNEACRLGNRSICNMLEREGA